MTAAVVDLLVLAAQEAPEPEEVTAGWRGVAGWCGLVGAVVLLACSVVMQLRKVDFEEKDPDAPASEGSENDDKRNGTSTPS